MKNNIGKAANGRSCLRAFQNWPPSVVGSHFDFKHTLPVNFITMKQKCTCMSAISTLQMCRCMSGASMLQKCTCMSAASTLQKCTCMIAASMLQMYTCMSAESRAVGRNLTHDKLHCSRKSVGHDWWKGRGLVLGNVL